MPQSSAPIIVDRYAIYDRIAAGGMATVHLGRLLGEGGFSRTVAIKRLHPQYALDPEFVTMFLDEARLAARVRHPNVVPTLDVVAKGDEVFLVMEYIEGEPLSALLRAANDRGERIPAEYASSLVTGILEGLHAAHEAKDDQGRLLDIVHRDISPHNVIVGVDGIPRVIDFGVAKALGQVHSTREGQIRGKLAYMSPEQVRGGTVDARTDIFAASIVLWEALAGRKLFKAAGDVAVMHLVLTAQIEPPSTHAPGIPPAVDAVVLRGLARDPNDRFSTADEMAAALEEALPGAHARKVGAWVREVGGLKLVERAAVVRDIERSSTGMTPASMDRQAALAEGARADSARSDGARSVPVTASTQGSSVSLASPTVAPGPGDTKTRVLPMVLGACVGLSLVLGAVALLHSRTPAPVAPTQDPVTAAAPPGPAPTPEPVAVPSQTAAAAPPPTVAATPPPTATTLPPSAPPPTPVAAAPAPSEPAPHSTRPPGPSHPRHAASPASAPSATIFSRF